MNSQVTQLRHDSKITAIDVDVENLDNLFPHAQLYWPDTSAAESVFEDEGCCGNDTKGKKHFDDLSSYVRYLKSEFGMGIRYVLLWHAPASKWIAFDRLCPDWAHLLAEVQRNPKGNLPPASRAALKAFKLKTERLEYARDKRNIYRIHRASKPKHIKKKFDSYFYDLGIPPRKTMVELLYVNKDGEIDALKAGHWNPHWWNELWCYLHEGQPTDKQVRGMMESDGKYLVGLGAQRSSFSNLRSVTEHLLEDDHLSYVAIWRWNSERWVGFPFSVGDWEAALVDALNGKPNHENTQPPTSSQIKEMLRCYPKGVTRWDVEDQMYENAVIR